jgi:hypothetical protein
MLVGHCWLENEMKTKDGLNGDDKEQASKGEGKQEGEQEGLCQSPSVFDKQTEQATDDLCPPKEERKPRQETGLRMWLTASLKEQPGARTHQEQEWGKAKEQAKQLRSDPGRLAWLSVAWSLLHRFSSG